MVYTIIFIVVSVIALIYVFGAIVSYGINKESPPDNNKMDTTDEHTRIEAIKRLAQLQSREVEFPRHKQILDESAKLIEDTNNINTLLSRYIDVLNELEWMHSQKDNGMPITLGESLFDSKIKLNRATNVNIVRIAEYHFNKLLGELELLKSPKAAQNRIAKMNELIGKCRSELKEHKNMGESVAELNGIEYKLEQLRNNQKQIYI